MERDDQRRNQPSNTKGDRGQASAAPAQSQEPTAVRPKGPAQTEPTPIADQWRLEKIYSEPESILLKPPKVKQLLAGCIFVFDTSALLTPYESDKATIAEIRRVLKPLAEVKRLFVPQRALREFANNRGCKITDTAAKLLQIRQQSIDIPPIPFLGNMRTTEALKSARDQLLKQVEAYHATLDQLVEEIRGMNYDDPISELYRELFPKEQIIMSSKSRDELEKDFARRVEFQIPPGYEDKHIGDLVIWHSILDHGEKEKKDTVFISNDIKEDWAHRIGEKEFGQMVAARYELVYEYHQRTEGKSYAQLQLAELLKHLKASETAVKAVEASQRAALAHGIFREHSPTSLVGSLSEDERRRRIMRMRDHLQLAINALSAFPPQFQRAATHLSVLTRLVASSWLQGSDFQDLVRSTLRDVRVKRDAADRLSPDGLITAQQQILNRIEVIKTFLDLTLHT